MGEVGGKRSRRLSLRSQNPENDTHQNKLVDVDSLVAQFAIEVAALGEKLSIVLVRLPPKLVFDPKVAESFFALLRTSINAQIACEPRNSSWSTRASAKSSSIASSAGGRRSGAREACRRSRRMARTIGLALTWIARDVPFYVFG